MKILYSFVVVCLLSGLSFISDAQPGTLDATFGTGGIAIGPTMSSIDRGQDILLQDDGKIIVAGYSELRGTQNFSCTRYTPDGAIDVSFGNNGWAEIDGGTDSDLCWSAVLQDDGKIILAGSVYNQFSTVDDFAMVRLNSDGSPDLSFGSSGIVITDIAGFWDNAYSVILQPDGKILLGGEAYNNTGRDYCVVRYLPDGSLDNTFGNGGIVLTDFGSEKDRIRGMAMQDDGKILAVGWTENANDDDLTIARYLPDGNLDNTFGSGGTLVYGEVLIDERAWAVKSLSDGKIMLCGFVITDGGFLHILIGKLVSDGGPDASFGTNGFSIPEYNSNEIGLDFVLQADGKILVTGGSFHFAVSRYHPDGSKDLSFGDDGLVMTNPGSSYSFSNALLVQPDGKIIVGGLADDGTGNDFDFTVLRYNSEGTGGILQVENVFGSSSIYPNPASSHLICDLPILHGPRNISLYDVFGRMVSEIDIPSGQEQVQLDVSEYKSGMYIAVLRSGSTVLGHGKFVKK